MRELIALTLVVAFACLFVLIPDSASQQAPDAPPSEFTYARIRYHVTAEGFVLREAPWHHDYPYSDRTLPEIVRETTGIRTSSESHDVVDIDSPDLFNYPFAYLCEPGYIALSDQDARNLREYLDRGGFLLVDDFRTADFSRQGGIRGPEDDIGHFQEEMRKVYTDRSFVRLDLPDPIFHMFYDIHTLDMEAPYIFPGQGPVEFWGLRDEQGRLQMILDNNNDISEYWQWIDEGQKSIHEASTSLQFGINDIMYAMTH